MEIVKKNLIRTERLMLKPYEEKDRSSLTAMLMNEEIAKTFMIPDYQQREQYEALADRLIRFSQAGDTSHLEYGIYLQGTLIGFINDCGFDAEEIEIGYVIHPDHKDHGYATEAVRAMIDELWGMGFKRIKAGFFEENKASQRVMEKCGMKLTETYDQEEYRGTIHQCRYCVISRA